MSYAANSQYVRSRIRETWGRDSEVIYPPVRVRHLQSGNHVAQLTEQEIQFLATLPDTFILGASRLIPYKRIDLAIRAAAANNLPVVIAGTGPEEETLKAQARADRVPARFTGRASDALLIELFQRASAYVFMAIEDFGIMPVEAMALGTPVIAGPVGGTLESIRLCGGGVTVTNNDPSAADFRSAYRDASNIDTQEAANAALIHFDSQVFRSNIRKWTES